MEQKALSAEPQHASAWNNHLLRNHRQPVESLFLGERKTTGTERKFSAPKNSVTRCVILLAVQSALGRGGEVAGTRQKLKDFYGFALAIS